MSALETWIYGLTQKTSVYSVSQIITYYANPIVNICGKEIMTCIFSQYLHRFDFIHTKICGCCKDYLRPTHGYIQIF